MKIRSAPYLLLLLFTVFYCHHVSAQQTAASCKVEMAELNGAYAGDCKNGFAHGKGEAKGQHRFTGQFKHGVPNGQGTYYYSDSVYHTGSFQDGIKEGKGTSYYLRAGRPDSLVKGYWSANVYRGKSYTTYTVNDMPAFEQVDITPSDESGNTLTIEIETTSGAIRGSINTLSAGPVNTLTVNEVIALDGTFIRKLELPNTLRYTTTYEIGKFPVRLQVMLSNARSFTLELYKAAKWKVQLFMNK